MSYFSNNVILCQTLKIIIRIIISPCNKTPVPTGNYTMNMHVTFIQVTSRAMKYNNITYANIVK